MDDYHDHLPNTMDLSNKETDEMELGSAEIFNNFRSSGEIADRTNEDQAKNMSQGDNMGSDDVFNPEIMRNHEYYMSGRESDHAADADGESDVSSEDQAYDSPSYIPVPIKVNGLPSKAFLSVKDELPDADALFGPRCWKCYGPETFFTCEMCGKHYHRQCIFLGKGFPVAVFNKSLEVVASGEKGVAVMLKCSECIVGEETFVPGMKDVPFDTLSVAMIRVANSVFQLFREQEFQKLNDDKAMNLSKILSKAENRVYGTVEGFHSDYKLLLFDTQLRHGETSEKFEVAKNIIRVACEELKIMLACMDCYNRRWDADGKLQTDIQYSLAMRETCRVPHLLVWVKVAGFPFWPAKALNIDASRKQLLFQCFGEMAVRREVLNGKFIRVYSQKRPGKKPMVNHKQWSKAVTDCDGYIQHARERFGAIVMNTKDTPFEGDLIAARKVMYPEFYGQVNEENPGSNEAVITNL